MKHLSAPLLLGMILHPASGGLLEDAEAAVNASVVDIETMYSELFGGQLEITAACEWYDACDIPPVSSETCSVIPDWETSGTPFHSMCDASSSAQSYPEQPDCPATTHTTCSLDVSYSASNIKLVTGSDPYSKNMREAVCVLSDLDRLWEEDYVEILDLNNYPENIYASVGDTGSFIQYPAVEWQGCPDTYDPRFRPWYSSAATGPKNVIIIIDTSGSMGSYSRMSLAKEAATKVLNTLNDYDYIGIVEFDTEASRYSTRMKQFTTNEACLISDYIDDLYASGGTNFIGAFDEAFDMYEASIASGDVSACDLTAMLFLTDGEAPSPVSTVASRNANHTVKILTYALGSSADNEHMIDVACANGGAAFQIPDDGDLGTIMASYYNLLAASIVPETVRPTWVRYRVWTSGNFIGSVCKSAFHRNTDGVERLYGVACADLTEDHIQDWSEYEAFEDRLTASSQYCPTFTTPSDNQLELIRQTLPGAPFSCSFREPVDQTVDEDDDFEAPTPCTTTPGTTTTQATVATVHTAVAVATVVSLTFWQFS